jgi:hypothetical protein
MSLLAARYSALLQEAKASLRCSLCTGSTKSELLGKVPRAAGVYIISEKAGDGRPLYIGCSGKLGRDLVPSGSHMRQRLNGALTPYQFTQSEFCFSPTSSGIPPADYASRMKIEHIQIDCLPTPVGMAPVFLESALLQGFINEFGALPVANQKV